MSFLKLVKASGIPIDFAIEPHPFNPKDFIDENPLVWEIKNTGERVL